MKEQKVRERWLSIRLNGEEYTRLQRSYKRSKSGSLSAYARSVLLKEPVTIIYRNESADEILSVLIALKNELNALGNNFNQVVKKLHTLDKVSDIQVWAMMNETRSTQLFSKVEEIRLKMHQIHSLCSQK